MSEPYIGEIRMFGASFAPAGWADCSGQLMPISQNDTLFNLIGTTYGGDGQETFAVPNLNGRVPMHQGQGPGISQTYQLGQQEGVESVTLTVQQIPVHSHAYMASNQIGQSAQPANAYHAQVSTGAVYNEPLDPLVAMNAVMCGPTGGSQPHENMQAYLCIRFIISLFGIFPHQ